MRLVSREVKIISAVGERNNNKYLYYIRQKQKQRIIVNEFTVVNYGYIHYTHKEMRRNIGEKYRKCERINNRLAFSFAYIKAAVYYIHHHINQRENAEGYKRCARRNKHKIEFTSENQEKYSRADAEE